jgi:hypothetical protein
MTMTTTTKKTFADAVTFLATTLDIQPPMLIPSYSLWHNYRRRWSCEGIAAALLMGEN